LLLQSRAAGGLASVCIWTAYLELIRRHVTVRTRATTLGLFTAGIPAGFVVGQLSGPLVADLLSWEWIFAVFTVPTVVGYLLFKLLAPDWSAPANGERSSTPRLGDFAQILSNGAVWSICLMGFVSTSVFLFFNSWMPTYLTETFGVSLAQSGAFVALFPLIGLVGRTSSGVLSGTVFGARRRPITRLSFLGSALSMVLVVAVSTSLVVVPLALAAGFCMQVAMGIYFTYVSETADPVVATTALSLLTFSGLVGAASAPVVTGVLIERFGTYAAAFSFVTALLFAGLVLAWRTPESNPDGA
jgi:nitrate/nitrite transporter NarK